VLELIVIVEAAGFKIGIRLNDKTILVAEVNLGTREKKISLGFVFKAIYKNGW